MSATTAKALWITGPEKAELRSQSLAEPGPDEVLVRTRYGAVSRGTEALVWRGNVPKSEAASMRAPFQEGDFPWPVKYGYIAVGEVEKGPPSLRGRTVFCLHPHQDRFVVPASAVAPLPEDVPATRAVLAANMETAVNAMWDAEPVIGERIAVIGAGAVGCLAATLAASVPGTAVQLIDILAAKSAIAAALGLDFASPENAAGEADLVIHASGNPKGLETALALAGLEGRIVELSWFGTARADLALGGAFHSRRLKLIASQVGRLPAHRAARWNPRRRMALALSLLRDPVYDALITGEDAFAALPETYAGVMNDPSVLCRRIRYD